MDHRKKKMQTDDHAVGEFLADGRWFLRTQIGVTPSLCMPTLDIISASVCSLCATQYLTTSN